MSKIDANCGSSTEGSQFAARVRATRPVALRIFDLDSNVLGIFETVVELAIAFTGGGPTKHLVQKLSNQITGLDAEAVQDWLSRIPIDQSSAWIERWSRRLRGQSFNSFALRLLGTSTYSELKPALEADLLSIASAIRTGARNLLPFLLAWDDAMAIVSRGKGKSKSIEEIVALEFVAQVCAVDQFLGDHIFDSLLSNSSSTGKVQVPAISVTEISTTVRALLLDRTIDKVAERNEPLTRKIRGARDALESSVDGTSQAANSLIELIDRMLREENPHDRVFDWLTDNSLQECEGLTFLTESRAVRPTKRAEVLCFLYGAGPVARLPTDEDDGSKPTVVHEVLTLAITTARGKLQALKHAD